MAEGPADNSIQPTKTRVDSTPPIKDGDAAYPLIPGYVIDTKDPTWKPDPGGQGDVYLYRHERTGLQVVAKVFKDGQDEAIIVKSVDVLRSLHNGDLHHDQIVKIRDFSRLPDGRPYMLMDRIRGEPLHRFIKNLLEQNQTKPIPNILHRLVLLCWRIASIVSYIHESGIGVHRDLKPSNILVASDPEDRDVPYILDIELIKTAKSSEPKGFTIDWAAPEQCNGDETDASTDVHAIGLILYYVITGGRFPYIERTRDARFTVGPIDPRIRIDQPVSEGELDLPAPANPIPNEICTIVLKAINQDKKERFGTAGELAREMYTHLLEAEPLTGRRGRSSVSRVFDTLERILKQFDSTPKELAALEWFKQHNQGNDLRAILEDQFSNRSLLFWAIETGDPSQKSAPHARDRIQRRSLELVRRIIEAAPSLINMQDAFGWSPLHLAANLGLVDVVHLLLSKNADPTMQARNGKKGGQATPLYEAAFCSYQDEARLVIELLAESANKRRGGRDIINEESLDGFTPLMAAIWRDNRKTAELLAHKYKADQLRWKDSGFEVYHLLVKSYWHAVQLGDKQTIDQLLLICDQLKPLQPSENPNPYVSGINALLMRGDTPKAIREIRYAVKHHEKEELGKQFGPFERTLLHQAAECGYLEVVKLLCEQCEVDPLVRNNHGRTARELVPTEWGPVRQYLREREFKARFAT
jgi:serine/threonine protein kinase